MKSALSGKSVKISALFAVVFLVFSAADSFGQNKRVSDVTGSKYALENIIAGICSGNEGVRESAIYLAGEHRFIDTEDALISQLRVEEKADLKVLIGLALFRMNSEKGMAEIQNLARKDRDSRVRRMSQAIYNEYLVSSSEKTAGID